MTKDDMRMTTIYVCTTCRRAQEGGALAECKTCAFGGPSAGNCANCPLLQGGDAPRHGARLLEAIQEIGLPEGIQIKGVECLSACSNSCSVALSAKGKWTYVYGNLDPMLHAADVVEGATRYNATEDGLVPWRERPEIFRKQSIARIPPQE